MNPSQSSDGNSERLEQIVAYLDGEMSSADSAQVEQQLVADEDFRREFQSIDRAWAALDELPSTMVDDSFQQTTMEMVVDSARREIVEKTQSLPVLRRKRRLSTALLGVVAAVFGVFVFRLVWSNPNQYLLADLPVIYHLDIYSQFEQADFLRMLGRAVPDDDWSLSKEELAEQEEQLQMISATESQREWLGGMSDEERLSLRANFNRFRGLPAAEQGRLRNLHHEIETARDHEKLRQTMLHYEQWLNDLPASEQYSLRELPAAGRARHIARMVHESEKDGSLHLTPKQLKQFWESMRPQMESLQKQVLADLSEEKRKQFEGERRRYQGRRGDLRQRFFWLKFLTPIEIEKKLLPVIQNSLPDEAWNQFLRLPPEKKRDQLVSWWLQIQRLRNHNWKVPGGGRSGEALQKELEEFFVEELDPGEKERLLALPHDQMQRQLERLYRGVSSHRGWGGPPEHEFRPPRGFGPPPGLENFRRDHRGGDRPGRGERRTRRPPVDGERPGPPPPPLERP